MLRTVRSYVPSSPSSPPWSGWGGRKVVREFTFELAGVAVGREGETPETYASISKAGQVLFEAL